MILMPCKCGKVHQLRDPGCNIRFKCKNSGATLVYECTSPEGYRLRGEDKDIILDRDQLTIGRLAVNEVVLAHGGLSRKHCRLLRVPDGYEIEDLGSSNGTYVNTRRLDPGERILLLAGDYVRLADRRFRFLAPIDDTAADRAAGADTRKLAAVGLEKSDVFDPQDELVGRDLGEFKILKLLAQGGMGRVYLARQVSSGRKAVVKTIIPEQAAKDKLMERFLREIDMGARIVHPGIIEFLGTGQFDGMLFLAMEYFEGRTLREWFRKRPASNKTALAIGRQMAAALTVAHSHNVVHRDIKPDNILMNREQWIKVIDFGIAKAVSDPDYASLTMSGAVIGTPRYMAPEQLADSKNVGPATDIYAMGAVLYYCLTCRPPRTGRSLVEIIRSMQEPVVPVSELRKGVPPALSAVLEKALAQKPEDRFKSATRFGRALEKVVI